MIIWIGELSFLGVRSHPQTQISINRKVSGDFGWAWPGVCLINIPELSGRLPSLAMQFWSDLFSFCEQGFCKRLNSRLGQDKQDRMANDWWAGLECNLLQINFCGGELVSPWTVYREAVKTGRSIQALQDDCLAFFSTPFKGMETPATSWEFSVSICFTQK